MKRKFFIRALTVFYTLSLTSFLSNRDKDIEPARAATVITERMSQSDIDNYYRNVDENATGETLLNSLANVVKADRQNSFGYKTLQDSAFKYTDVDPERPNDGYIVSFYSGTPVYGYTGMNKEHTWPNSHGGNKVENDPHVIRPTLESENSDRGNEYYAESSSNGWDPASFGNPKYRGISARIIFYAATVGKSSGLVLEDVGRTQGTGTGNRMGKLGDLLKWNLEYPVDQSEIIRNETLDRSLSWNRNPFIDDPSYACRIWGNTNTNTQNICATYGQVIEPTSINLTPNSASLRITETVDLTVGVTPSNASKQVTWTSSNTSVATVSNGKVTAKAVGTTTITATSTANTSVKGTAVITVTNDPILVTGISLTPTNLSISLNETATLNASVIPSNATNKSITWSTSNSSIVTVNNGVVKGIGLGNATVTAKTVDGGFTKSCLVNVTTAPAIKVVSANFYNSVDNNGTGTPTPANLNNGGNEYDGFKGEQVVSKVTTTTQCYLPRGGGLAIGSSSNPGTLTFQLNSDYYTNKVEALFNDTKLSGVTINLSGNRTGTTVNGSIGGRYSNPSTGAPYVITFNEPASEITINTSKRVALVELKIHVKNVNAPTPEEEAMQWANTFLNETNSGCASQSKTMLSSKWSSLKSSYLALSSDARTYISTQVPNGNGNALEEALARYELIINKYGLEHFINNANLQAAPLNSFMNTNSLIVITSITTSLLIILFTLLFYKRRQKRLLK